MGGGVSGSFYQPHYVLALVPAYVPAAQTSQLYLVPGESQPASDWSPIPVPPANPEPLSQQAPVERAVLKQKKMSILGKAGWALVGLGVAVGIAAAVLFVLYHSKTDTTIIKSGYSYIDDVITVSKSSTLLHAGIGAAVFAGGVFAAGSGLLIGEQMKKRKKAESV